MSLYCFELGRKKKLCLAELITVLGLKNLVADNFDNLVFNLKDEPDQKLQNLLGGTIKIMKIFAETTPSGLHTAIEQRLKNELKGHSGKIPFAVNIYGSDKGTNIRIKEILNFSKKIIKSLGLNCRFVNKGPRNTNTATLHRAKILQKGIDLCIIQSKTALYLGETITIQDIDNYSKRDFNKPCRDAKIGMLPPKLAQILINLAGPSKTVYDPFCGSGTILMEAMLMGKNAIGSDINQRMVNCSKTNCEWLTENFKLEAQVQKPLFFTKDAKFLNLSPESGEADVIVTEGYLGEPQLKTPTPEKREAIFRELSNLHLNWLKAVNQATKKSCKIVTCVTAFQINGKIEHFPRFRELTEFAGYKIDVMYSYDRPDQIVVRDIAVLSKK